MVRDLKVTKKMASEEVAATEAASVLDVSRTSDHKRRFRVSTSRQKFVKSSKTDMYYIQNIAPFSSYDKKIA